MQVIKSRYDFQHIRIYCEFNIMPCNSCYPVYCLEKKTDKDSLLQKITQYSVIEVCTNLQDVGVYYK